MVESPWTEECVEDLIRLWADETRSASMIGKALGLTKNQVLGKVHRLGLPKRRNPIGARGPANPRYSGANSRIDMRGRLKRRPKPKPKQRVKGMKGCQWIEKDGPDYGIDDPTGHSDSFKCGDKVKPGSSYCAEHHALCYVRVSRLKSSGRFAVEGRAGEVMG